MEVIEKVVIFKYDNGKIEEKEDVVVKESPFTIFLNKEELLTLLCTPKSLDYLTYGFLLSEGFIKSKGDIESISLFEEEDRVDIVTNNKSEITNKLLGKRTMTTGCGKGTTFYNALDLFNSKQIHSEMKVQGEDLIGIINKFNKASDLFLNTGGVHSASLSDGKELLLFHEDVGRHNA
ncbi:MAG: formate dehydrogenase accessory sulfurtransferase FdhD, partial [Clostridiaceae bacterium]|nr:formate dehydrogenase accessory sulfurtransferase FdhD [Clostridiaceae bacterium]